MKRMCVGIIVLAVLLCISLPAWAEKYTDPAMGFSLEVPKGWKVDASGEGGVALKLTCPTKSAEGGTPVITLGIGKANGVSLEQYRAQNRAELKNLKDYRMTMEKTFVARGVKWYQMIFDFKQDNIRVGASFMYTIQNDLGFTFTYMAPTSLYSVWLPAAERAVKSFTFPTKKL